MDRITGNQQASGAGKASPTTATAEGAKEGRSLLSNVTGALWTDFKNTVNTVAQAGNLFGAIADASSGKSSNISQILS